MATLTGLAVIPVLLLVGLLCKSPNYRTVVDPNQPLAYPLGGDYLQEYIGGRLISQTNTRDQLYDQEFFQAAQHDPQGLGFAWDDNRYFPAVYPPHWYAAVSPLSELPYLTAARGWFVLMTTALLLAIWLLRGYARVPAPALAILCLAPPVIACLASGQKGTLLLLILTATYLLQVNGRPLLSGLTFSLIAFKPHLGLAIGLLMLVLQNWRWAAGAVLGVLVWAGVPLLLSSSLLIDYVQSMLNAGNYVQTAGYNLHQSYSLWSFWQLLLKDAAAAKYFTVASSLVVLTGAATMIRSRWKTADEQPDWRSVFSVMILATIVTAPHFYDYDLTILLLPVGLLTRVTLDSVAGGLVPSKKYIAWVPVALLVAVLFLNNTLIAFAKYSGIQLGVGLLLTAGWLGTRLEKPVGAGEKNPPA